MRDHLINWQMPAQPLGPAIKAEKPAAACPLRLFETGDHKFNGAAQAPQSESERTPAEAGCVTPEAAPPFKIGDRVQCQYGPGVVTKVSTHMASVMTDAELEGTGRGPYAFGICALKLLDTSPATPKADAEGWIKHDGKGAPSGIGPDVKVQVRWFDGTEVIYDFDCICGWDEVGCITHYRLVPQ